MSAYPKEKAQFCTGFNPSPSGGTTWTPVGTTGPIMAVSTETTPGVFTLSYAQVGSDSIALAGLPPVPGTTGSWWLYALGRWPIKETRKLVAASWSTTAILQHCLEGTYERHRVYILDAGKVCRVWVSLRGQEVVREMMLPEGQSKFVETQQAGAAETLSDPADIGAAQSPFVNAVKAYVASLQFPPDDHD